MQRVLKLAGTEPIAQGNKRLVFQHPHDPDLVVKVMRPEVVQARWGAGARWYKMNRRHGHYVNFVREIGEQIALRVRVHGPVPCVQRFEGLVDTDFGLGLIAVKLRDRAGNLAPTLASVVLKEGLTAELEDRLNAFLQQALACNLVIGKLHTLNLVYAWDPDVGEARLVMIDGIGEKTVVPFLNLAGWINRRHTRKCFLRLMRGVRTLAAEREKRAETGAPR
jgi:hypothetical protein